MGTLHDIQTPLFRAFTKERYADDFLQGKFRLGALNRYRRIEDPSRQDIQEGYGHYVDGADHEWHFEFAGPIYVLCLSNPNIDFEYLRSRMGHFVVRLNNPETFVRTVEGHLCSGGIRSFNGLHGKAVNYNKGHIIDQEVDPSDRALLSVAQKPDTYRRECEYRLFTILNQHPRTPYAEFLEIDLGNPIQSAELVRGA